MKSTTLKTINFFLLAIVFLYAGCTRDEDKKPATKTELLTAAPWKFSQAGIDLNMDGTIDQPLRPDLIPACSTDNIFTFSTNGTGVLDENINQCNTGLPKLSPFTWYFLNEEKEIYISSKILPIIEGNLNIVELSETRFSVGKPVGVHGFPNYLNVVIVFVHWSIGL